MVTNEVQIWDQLNKNFNESKEFRDEMTELIRFYSSKLIQLADTTDKEQFISEIIEKCIFSQYFHGYALMKRFIEQSQLNEENVFYPGFWEIPKGVMLNEIGDVMKFQFEKGWAFQEAMKHYDKRFIQLFPEGYDLYREVLLEVANYGAYKAVIESEYYKGPKTLNEEKILLGSINDIHFVNPQVFMKVKCFSNENEIWDLFRINNGNVMSSWLGTIHLATIPKVLEKSKDLYILNVSLSDMIRNDEKHRILVKVLEKVPEEMKEETEIRLYHLSDMELKIYNKPSQ